MYKGQSDSAVHGPQFCHTMYVIAFLLHATLRLIASGCMTGFYSTRNTGSRTTGSHLDGSCVVVVGVMEYTTNTAASTEGFLSSDKLVAMGYSLNL